MGKYYNVQDIKADIERDIERYSAFLESWKNVSFPVKKDGKPFSNMQKNINGAKYATVSYAMQSGEYELTVCTNSPKNGYIHDSINAYELICYLKDEKRLAKTENYMPKQPYLNQVYKYDIDDIKAAVNERIAYIERYITDLKAQYRAAENVYSEFKQAFSAAVNTLESATAGFTHKNLYYAVKETVIERYPYC